MERTVILDNGHGIDTAGKRSPIWADGTQLFEWEFNRDIVKRIAARLAVRGIKYHILVSEDTDVSLGERCRRANAIFKADPSVYLISIHANAGGGTGFECFTSVGDTAADPMANIMCEEAVMTLNGFPLRSDKSDEDLDKESQFYILKNTACPAILTENLFMDTEKDCRYLMDENGRAAIAQYHVDAICRINDI